MALETTAKPIVAASEIAAAKHFYTNSEAQPLTYEGGVPDYARAVAELIASLAPRNVLEFGCNGGRNLDVIRALLPDAKLVGVDLNPLMVERGRARFGLDLRVEDESWLSDQPDDCFDVSFTVSVLDHIPYAAEPIRNLLRVTRDFLVLFELAHDRLGRADTYLTPDAQGGIAVHKAYPCSYIHDYRYECERKFGALCVVDVHSPTGESNLLDLYRLYVFTKQKDWRTQRMIKQLVCEPIAALRQVSAR